jgi:hypothetical protein
MDFAAFVKLWAKTEGHKIGAVKEDMQVNPC